MHLGSLYTAAASYLDARAHGGRWVLRMEDLDTPRVIPGAAERIIKTVERFGFEWDGAVVRQSERTASYAAALATLRARQLTFECTCSRSDLSLDERYPGHCRTKTLAGAAQTATRVRIEPGRIDFTDRIQGRFRQDVAASVGDVVIRRRDGWFAYVLAVVIDDDAQGITHVVRGADLLDNTPRQIYLQRLLALATPSYAHVPVLSEPNGRKLSKSARSINLDEAVMPQLIRTFELLNLCPPQELSYATPPEAWNWAGQRWRIDRVPRKLELLLER